MGHEALGVQTSPRLTESAAQQTTTPLRVNNCVVEPDRNTDSHKPCLTIRHEANDELSRLSGVAGDQVVIVVVGTTGSIQV